MQTQHTATTSTVTTTVTEEDWFRAANRSWRDTAFGRRRHFETCAKATHHDCGDAA